MDIMRAWWDLTTKSATVAARAGTELARAGGQAVRTVSALPLPVTVDGLDAWRTTAARYLRALLEIPDDLVNGQLSPQAADAVMVVRALMASDNGHDPDDAAIVRERFQQLLERSTDVSDDPGEPAFLDIVAQLTPDEARIVRYLSGHEPVAAMDLLALRVVGRTQRVVLRHQSLLAERAGCAHPERGDVYLDNLHRLGLIDFTRDLVDDDTEYQLIEGTPAYVSASRELRGDRTVRLKGRRGCIALTALGRRFLALCLGEDRVATSDA